MGQSFFNNQYGMGMVQVMVLGASLMGIGAYTISQMSDQQKVNKNVTSKQLRSAFVREVAEAMTLPDACANTLNQSGPLEDQKVFSAIVDKEKRVIYQGNQAYNGVIFEEIKIDKYVADPNPRYQEINLKIKVAQLGGAQSYGGKNVFFEIPIYLLTENNVVKSCQSDSAGDFGAALKTACEEVGGTFDEPSGACEFTGSEGHYLTSTSQSVCPEGEKCEHPYKDRKCEDGYNNNYAIVGFSNNSQLKCACMPRECPDPKDYCKGADLGDDWCGGICPPGESSASTCLSGNPGGQDPGGNKDN